jgi:putative tryptophan/tyrosine transport system substrate-binding protein
VLVTQHSHAAESVQRVVRVGFVDPESPSTTVRGVPQFWERLRELGWVEGHNLVIEARWAEGNYDRLPALMAEVLARNVDVLVTTTTPAAIAAEKATRTVPIVVAAMGDPVGTGLVNSLARPGGNLTGLSLQWADLSGKWLELLQETIPRLSTLAVISNPASPIVRKVAKDLQVFAAQRRLKLRFEDVRESAAFSDAFERARQHAQAALVLADPLVLAAREQITALAAANRLPALYVSHEFMVSGGLMTYAVDSRIMFRRAAEYVDKILRGARPGDLPIEQPTQLSLAVNLKAAKALGITIPESILLRADEVIR